MILDVQAKVQQMVAAGIGLDEVRATKLTARYDAQVKGGLDLVLSLTSADRFVGTLYAEVADAQ